MNARAAKSSSTERLRASPNFVLAFAQDGRPYVAKETEPYIQYWLSERDRILLSMFSRRGGASAAEAADDYCRLTRSARDAVKRRRLIKAIDNMRAAGVVVGTRDDVSRYSAKIVAAYLEHRPFPRALSDFIKRRGAITAATRVLDLAGGPGDLAMQLAETSRHVSLMELSHGFVTAARARAKRLGLHLTTIHESCNRLVFNDDEYDVITVSQALHWLDDVLVCRGICRVLRPGGSFFVVHGSMSIADTHPLSFVLGDKSILGHKKTGPFRSQVEPMLRRLRLLFEALDAPDVDRIDPAQRWTAPGSAGHAGIVPVGVSFFRQRRPFGIGFARGFLTPQHIEVTGMTPAAFWKDLEARCANAAADQLGGIQEWAVLHFQRGGTNTVTPSLENAEFVEIGFESASPP